MSEHPILFCAEMIQAYLAGRKWETRRVIKFPKHTYTPDASWVKSIHQDGGGNWIAWSTDAPDLTEFTKKAYPGTEGFPCPYGKPGDSLWVRETWQARSPVGLEWNRYKRIEREGYAPSAWRVRYAATDLNFTEWSGWNPSIFMPHWASRISFPVLSIRAERVQDISEDDAIAEGVEVIKNQWGTPWYKSVAGEWKDPINPYRELWDRINAKRGFPWDSNPWVWVITFPKYEAAQ